MLEGTRIPPVDVETLPDDLREVLEEQRKRGARRSIRTSTTRAMRRTSARRRRCVDRAPAGDEARARCAPGAPQPSCGLMEQL
jgi:hypothetical protein